MQTVGAANENRIFGPPGTGKTTFLAGSIRKTAQTRRTSEILVASFTRAAAEEIASRGIPVNRSNVGTLHSLAYRAIGSPPVAEEHLKEWNKRHPQFAMTPGWDSSVDDAVPADQVGSTDGDRIMSQVDTLRARLIPEQMWPVQAQSFHRRWAAWKDSIGVIDYTDMIEHALSTTEQAPNAPAVGYFDEAQDFTPLELALVRHWGTKMEAVIIAGDDDQVLYSFKGATPDAFLDPPIPDERKWVLSQSYRVPVAVHAAAETWVKQLSRREPKEYKPRDFEGSVVRSSLRYTDAQPVVRAVRERVDQGKTVMILTSCSYMLDHVKHQLRSEGVPFHNPYRKTRMDWNPLRSSRGTSATERLLAYLVLDERLLGTLARDWTGRDVRTWAQVIKKQGVFKRGAQGAIDGLPDRTLTYDEVAQLFESEEELARCVEPSLEWFQSNLLAGSRKSMEYPIQVVRKSGVQALVDTPRVILGTIHSTKGGEADSVILFPDLSSAGMREWQERGPSRDSVIRLMYVGMTRAREELIVASNSSPLAVDPSLLLRGAPR